MAAWGTGPWRPNLEGNRTLQGLWAQLPHPKHHGASEEKMEVEDFCKTQSVVQQGSLKEKMVLFLVKTTANDFFFLNI